MTLQELYTALHGDYADATSRLMNDKLIERFVLKFPADPSMGELRTAIDAGDVPTQFRMAHTLKGVAANLAFTELQESASALTEQLRPQAEPADPALFADLEKKYQLVVDTLTAYQAEK